MNRTLAVLGTIVVVIWTSAVVALPVSATLYFLSNL